MPRAPPTPGGGVINTDAIAPLFSEEAAALPAGPPPRCRVPALGHPGGGVGDTQEGHRLPPLPPTPGPPAQSRRCPSEARSGPPLGHPRPLSRHLPQLQTAPPPAPPRPPPPSAIPLPVSIPGQGAMGAHRFPTGRPGGKVRLEAVCFPRGNKNIIIIIIIKGSPARTSRQGSPHDPPVPPRFASEPLPRRVAAAAGGAPPTRALAVEGSSLCRLNGWCLPRHSPVRCWSKR